MSALLDGIGVAVLYFLGFTGVAALLCAAFFFWVRLFETLTDAGRMARRRAAMRSREKSSEVQP